MLSRLVGLFSRIFACNELWDWYLPKCNFVTGNLGRFQRISHYFPAATDALHSLGVMHPEYRSGNRSVLYLSGQLNGLRSSRLLRGHQLLVVSSAALHVALRKHYSFLRVYNLRTGSLGRLHLLGSRGGRKINEWSTKRVYQNEE